MNRTQSIRMLDAVEATGASEPAFPNGKFAIQASIDAGTATVDVEGKIDPAGPWVILDSIDLDEAGDLSVIVGYENLVSQFRVNVSALSGAVVDVVGIWE